MLTLAIKVDNLGVPTFVSSAAHLVLLKRRSSFGSLMKSRFLIPVLCVGAVVYACGPRAHNEASTPKKTGATVAKATTKPASDARRPSARKAKDAKSPVSGLLYVHAGDSSIRLAFHVVNTTDRRVEITFPSGQTYDFVILDSLGREMWHWGSGRMFTQTLRNKVLDGGETLDVEEIWRAATLAPGRYTAKAVLTSENYPLVQQTDFTVEATTVAQRD